MVSKKVSGGTKAVAGPRRKTAFVSAPVAVDTSVVVSALRERGLETLRIDELGTGLSISELIRDSIGRSDYLIAVMGERPSGNVLFEVGMAAGMGKPVLILASDHGEFPLAASGFSYLKADPTNREAIEFGLDQLLSAPKSKAALRMPGGRETHAIGGSADRLLARLQALRESGAARESQLIDIVHDAVKESGVSTLAKESRNDEGRVADLAVWSDDLEPWIGNPLVVEVKKELAGRRGLEEAIVRVSRWLDETRSPYGLVLYLTAKPAILYGGPYDSRVMVMSIEEFIGGLRGAGLGDLLRRARSEVAHARG